MTSAGIGISLLVVFALLRLSHRLEPSPARDVQDQPPAHQIELASDNPESRTIFRFLGGLALLSQIVTWALFAVVSPFQAVMPAAITGPFCLVAVWRFSRYFRGEAEIRSEGIVVRAAGRTVRLHWQHIRSLDVTTFRQTRGTDAVFAALMYAGIDEPFVRVKLRRSLRVDTFAGLSGPEVAGLPTGIRQYRIWVTDPETFVTLAQPYLSANSPSLLPAPSLASPTSV
jgi:hypothetical protein